MPSNFHHLRLATVNILNSRSKCKQSFCQSCKSCVFCHWVLCTWQSMWLCCGVGRSEHDELCFMYIAQCNYDDLITTRKSCIIFNNIFFFRVISVLILIIRTQWLCFGVKLCFSSFVFIRSCEDVCNNVFADRRFIIISSVHIVSIIISWIYLWFVGSGLS